MWRFLEGCKVSEASKKWAERLNVPVGTFAVFFSRSSFKLPLVRSRIGTSGNEVGQRRYAGQIGVLGNSACKVAKGRPVRSIAIPAIVRLDAHSIIDGATQPLLAAEVLLRPLDRDVAERALDQVPFAAGKIAEPGATRTMMPHPVVPSLCTGVESDRH